VPPPLKYATAATAPNRVLPGRAKSYIPLVVIYYAVVGLCAVGIGGARNAEARGQGGGKGQSTRGQ